jgi:integrase
MAKSAPTGIKRTVQRESAPRGGRRLRDREHLTPQEVERLIAAARQGRWPVRDAALLLVMFTHGLRVTEAIRLRWSHFDLDHGILHIKRLKNGLSGDHRLRGIEIRALRRLRRDCSAPADWSSPRKEGVHSHLVVCSSCSTGPPHGRGSAISTCIPTACATPADITSPSVAPI